MNELGAEEHLFSERKAQKERMPLETAFTVSRYNTVDCMTKRVDQCGPYTNESMQRFRPCRCNPLPATSPPNALPAASPARATLRANACQMTCAEPRLYKTRGGSGCVT